LNFSGITGFNHLASLEQDKKNQQLQMSDFIPQTNKIKQHRGYAKVAAEHYLIITSLWWAVEPDPFSSSGREFWLQNKR
jgi:hypothetical protein